MSKILIDRATIEQALEALEAGPDVDPIFAGETEAALRAALAEPVQEPVSVDRCANCLRPKGEHQGDMCPRPYTTVWSAWDYEAKPVQEPVGAVLVNRESREGVMFYSVDMIPDPSTLKDRFELVPVYTAPPQQPEPAQEPVAWAFKHSDGTYHDPSVTEHSAGMVPLGPIRAQRPPLTDEEIWACLPPEEDNMAFARAIERKVRGE